MCSASRCKNLTWPWLKETFSADHGFRVSSSPFPCQSGVARGGEHPCELESLQNSLSLDFFFLII